MAGRNEHGDGVAIIRPRYRAIWISDVHLGTGGCNAGMLIDFLDHVDSDVLYLVGDMIDGWRLKKRFYWPPLHSDVVRRLLKRAKRGSRSFIFPAIMTRCSGSSPAWTSPASPSAKAIHKTANGGRLLILHGDEFDAITLAHHWLAHVGDTAYTALMIANRAVDGARRRLGLPYWSLSKHAEAKVKNAVAFISHFEEVVARAADSRGVDGVVCGHIHTAEMREIAGLAFYNDGDWVESCTALVEHREGRMELLHWADEIARRGRPPAALVAA